MMTCLSGRGLENRASEPQEGKAKIRAEACGVVRGVRWGV